MRSGLAQTAGILLNVDSIRDLGNLWKEQTLVDVANLLQTPTGTANVGNVLGNRMFWANDYMVRPLPALFGRFADAGEFRCIAGETT